MNRTYQNLKRLIEAGRYTSDDMWYKLTLYHSLNLLTDDMYFELTDMLPMPEAPEDPAEDIPKPETPVVEVLPGEPIPDLEEPREPADYEDVSE